MTSRATTSAFTLPFGPMVRQLFVVRLSFPSTTPSTKRSSLPVTSPLILIPWLIHADARDEIGRPLDTVGELAVAGLDELTQIAGVPESPAPSTGFHYTFFRIPHRYIEN